MIFYFMCFRVLKRQLGRVQRKLLCLPPLLNLFLCQTSIAVLKIASLVIVMLLRPPQSFQYLFAGVSCSISYRCIQLHACLSYGSAESFLANRCPAIVVWDTEIIWPFMGTFSMASFYIFGLLPRFARAAYEKPIKFVNSSSKWRRFTIISKSFARFYMYTFSWFKPLIKWDVFDGRCSNMIFFSSILFDFF